LLYFSAALNKLLDVDWRSGRYFQQAATLSPQHDLYANISSLLPPWILSTLLGWLVIVTEFALPLDSSAPGCILCLSGWASCFMPRRSF
jgi:hypothetical protein